MEWPSLVVFARDNDTLNGNVVGAVEGATDQQAERGAATGAAPSGFALR